MGKISGLKAINDEKVLVNLELTTRELGWLKGNMNKMHLFSETNLEHETRLIRRGKRESTKYFLLPKELRKGVLANNNVACNKIETKTKHIFVFSVPKYH